MTVRVRAGFEIDEHLILLNKLRTLNPNGSFSSYRFAPLDEITSYFLSAIEIRNETEAYIARVVRNAMNVEQAPTPSSFLAQLKREDRKLVRTRKRFRAVFPVWGIKGILLGRTKVDDVTIDYEPERKSYWPRVLKERARLSRSAKLDDVELAFVASNINVVLVECIVQAVDDIDCVQQSERALASELGLLTLMNLNSETWRKSYCEAKPISSFIICPFVTTHNKNGKVTREAHWVKPFPKSGFPVATKLENVEFLAAQIVKFRTHMSKLPWRRKAMIALVRYHDSCSKTSMTDAFLSIWRTLEFLATDRNTKSEVVVKRSAALWADHRLMHQIGKHLLFRRNELAHHVGVDANDDETLTFDAHRLLHPLMVRVIQNPSNFETYDEFLEFLDGAFARERSNRRMRIASEVNSFTSQP